MYLLSPYVHINNVSVHRKRKNTKTHASLLSNLDYDTRKQNNMWLLLPSLTLLISGVLTLTYFYGSRLIDSLSLRFFHRLQAIRRRTRPRRLILVRHGQSQGNVDVQSYATIPDSQLKLTDLGQQQALDAGQRLRALIGNESIYVYISPYQRSRETYANIEKAFDQSQILMIREDPRIREQEWGNFMNPEIRQKEMEDRAKVGDFFYRFINGESGADVYDRCTLFMDTLFRQLNSGHYQHAENILIVSHDIFIRLFLARFFRLTAAEHHQQRELKNCEHVLLEFDYETGQYELKTKLTGRRESQVIDYNAATLDKLVYKYTKGFSAIDENE